MTEASGFLKSSNSQRSTCACRNLLKREQRNRWNSLDAIASFLFKVKVKVKVRKRPMVCFVNVASRQSPLSYWPRVWETHFLCRLRSWIQELKWWMTLLCYSYLTTWKAQVATCVQIGTWPSIGPFHCFQLKRERNGPREKEAEKKTL